MEKLLPYYEKQLQEFGQQSRAFASQYPKIAQRLALNQEQIDDPHIERLIQAFSLIAARIDKKIDDSYDQFTSALFEVMFPQYLRHFPSCSIVSFDDPSKQKQRTQIQNIAKGTVLRSKSVKSVQCEFKTTMDVSVLPIQLCKVQFLSHPSQHLHLNQNASLSLSFEILDVECTGLLDYKVPIYLDAISNFPLQLLDRIFRKETCFSFKVAGERYDISNPFQTLGFQEQDSVLPIDQHTHHAYRLLLEYFCFPERFQYLVLDLSFLKSLVKIHPSFELNIHLKFDLNNSVEIRNYTELNHANFKLFTTPIVNLFEKQAEPQKINHQQLEYPLITDAHHPECYQVYSILEMYLTREKNNQEQTKFPVYPFFAMSHYHGNEQNFFYHLNASQYQHHLGQFFYSIVSKSLKPYAYSSDFSSIRLLCSNADLPYEALKQSQNILHMHDQQSTRRANLLKRPNKTFSFKHIKKEQWRIISHLSLNTIALMKGDAVAHLKELLALYNLPNSNENNLFINSIQSINFELWHKLLDTQPFPMFVRGVKVHLSIDPLMLRGQSIYLFSQILSHIFNLKVQMNSFVDLSIYDSRQGEELYQCIQNVGGKNPL